MWYVRVVGSNKMSQFGQWYVADLDSREVRIRDATSRENMYASRSCENLARCAMPLTDSFDVLAIHNTNEDEHV